VLFEMAHTPVLLKEVLNGLNISSGDLVVDATFGGGGHSMVICEALGKKGRLVALDADREATKRVSHQLKSLCNFELVVANFRNLDKVLGEMGIEKIDAILFDLGLSSFQLDEDALRRGFSFQRDEPLKMTFDDSDDKFRLTASEVINHWEEGNLADIIFGYGGERYARRIAKRIVESRKAVPIETTFELVRVIGEAVPDFYKRRKIHFATKTFQSIRITVNDELGAIREALRKSWSFLKVGGRLAVISFHELEDRIVKDFFRKKKQDGLALVVTKKPIVGAPEEIYSNPRARSATLRIGERI